MKKTFLLMTAAYAIYSLGVFGATTFMITVLALCGLHVTWWIGALCAVPGWLLLHVLHSFIGKSNVDEAHDTPGNMEIEEKADGCRFPAGGKCTYGDGLPEYVKKLGVIDDAEPQSVMFIQGDFKVIASCEDDMKSYIETSDGLRLIFREGKYVGWYVSGEREGGKDGDL